MAIGSEKHECTAASKYQRQLMSHWPTGVVVLLPYDPYNTKYYLKKMSGSWLSLAAHDTFLYALHKWNDS